MSNKTFCEGGINWRWFTELAVSDNGVTIIKNWRIHLDNSHLFPKDAIQHPQYYHQSIWRESEDGKRTALAYNVPDIGWLPILNPKYVGSYQ